MTSRLSRFGLAVVLLLTVPVVQPGAAAQTPRAVRTTPDGWTPPRTSDGRPSLEGVWENNSATPLERPSQFANKPRLSDDELAVL